MSNSEYNRERSRMKHSADPKKKLALNEKKFVITTAILSLLIVISVFNRNAFSSHKGTLDLASNSQDHSRQIASVPLGTTSSEDSLAKELSLKPLDDQARWGQNPSRVEQLTFGLLEGKYSVRLKDGKLNGFELTDMSTQPKMVQNLERFLSENREILPVKFDTISVVQPSKGDENVQKFALLSPASRRMAEVEFHLDGAGRLISMRINKSL